MYAGDALKLRDIETPIIHTRYGEIVTKLLRKGDLTVSYNLLVKLFLST
jgi:hypothetical protein